MKTTTTWAAAMLAMASFWALSASSAQAYSGYVSGYFKHYQHQGNYCDNDGRDCTGAQYLAAEHNSVVPLKNLVVTLSDQSGNTIGTGSTDTNGYFLFYWYSETMPTSAHVQHTLNHSLGRFQVFTPSGGSYVFSCSSFIITNGTTSSSPQYIGTYQWGNSGAPNALTNVYDGAEKMWRNALRYSSRMQSNFGKVSIRALSNTLPYACSSSCARGDTRIIQLDANGSEYEPQARIMHEMGHIADYDSNSYVLNAGGLFFEDLCYPYMSNTGCIWGLRSAEWRTTSFTEGIATFFGDTAIYWSTNAEPYTCLSSMACARSSLWNVETSTGSTCATGEDRWPITVDRYLRDMYDTHNDSGFGEAMNRPFYEFFDTLAQYSAGTGNHQENEMWNSIYTVLGNRDGRAASDDFGYNFTALTGLYATNQSTYNCTP